MRSLELSIEKDSGALESDYALTVACVECAKAAGYMQLELNVVSEIAERFPLYEGIGFREYGRNPKGFRSRKTGWQEIVLMRMELA